MRSILTILAVSIIAITGYSVYDRVKTESFFYETITDPGSYTAGTFVNWSFDAGVGAQDHGFFKAAGFDAAPDSLKRVVIHFEGDGETNSSGQHSQSPGKILQDAGTNWNGQVTRPDGKTVYFCVFTVYNTNNSWVYPYVQAVNYFFANTTNLPDTSLHKCYIMTGFSGGPFRAYSSLLDAGFTRENIFGFLGMVSPTDFTPSPLDISTLSANKYTMVWRNQGDANGGTPLTAAQHLFQYSTGSKQLVTPAGGSHSADQFFSIAGTDSATNRWYLMAMYQPPTGGGGGGGGHTPSNNKLNINLSRIADFNAIPGKTIKRLFDKDTLTNINESGIDQGGYVIPFESWGLLPYKVNNVKLRYFDASGGNTGLVITLFRERYNASSVTPSLDSLISFPFVTDNFGVWRVPTGYGIENVDSVFAFRITASTASDFDQTITELEIYGDSVGPAPNIMNLAASDTIADPGKFAFQVQQLGDKNMDTFALVANTMRIVHFSFQTQKGSEWGNPSTTYSLDFSKDNVLYPDGWNSSFMNKVRSYGLRYQHGVVGGDIKYLTSGQAASYDYNTWAITVKRKFMVPGADSSLQSTYAGFAHFVAAQAALFGFNTSPGRSYNYYGLVNSSYGQGNIAAFELQNEWNRNFFDPQAHYSIRAIYSLLKASYDSIKAVAPTMPVYLGPLTSMDENAIFSLAFVHYLSSRKSYPFPAEGMCFNTYLNNTYGSQSFSNSDYGITGEQFNLKARVTSFCKKVDSCFGNVKKIWTEYGRATASISPYNVVGVGSFDTMQVAAILTLRDYALARTIPHGIHGMTYYMFTSDGTVEFGSMEAARDSFYLGVYVTTKLLPVGNVLAQQKNLYANYKWQSDHLVDGDSTGVHVVRTDHVSNPNKKIFMLWKGVYDNSTTSYTLNLGSNATSAIKYDFSFNNYIPTTSSATITANQISVTASMKPVYFEVTYNQSSLPPVRWNRRIVGK